MDELRIQADFVIASENRILHPGQVVVRRGKIVTVTGDALRPPDLNLTDNILLPGLINAHTHLEFSDLARPFPAGPNFPAWISRVVAHRRESAAKWNYQQTTDARRAAILLGILEAMKTGTYVLGDIVTSPWRPDDLPNSEMQGASTRLAEEVSRRDGGEYTSTLRQQHLAASCFPKLVAFAELLGLTQGRWNETVEWASSLLGKDSSESDLIAGIGVSPHAPYSILMPQAQHILSSIPSDTLIAMHVAESRDELEFLKGGNGAFRASFQALGIPIPKSLPTIEDCIRLLGSRQRALLVHGNYLTESQIMLAAELGSIACVYCPRTHQHFGHEGYPLASMRKHGLPVVIGTDSRASTPDLNLWSEVVAARANHPDLTGSQAIAAITSGPARALGLGDSYGSLETGKVAALNIVPRQPQWNASNLLDEMTSSPLVCQPLR